MKYLFVALVFICVAGCLPMGQKLLLLEVLRGGEVILSTTFDAADTSTAAKIWDSAGEIPFSTEVDRVEPSKSDPLKAEIEGTVQIRVLWTDKVESTVTLEGLLLVRSARDADDWRLTPAEIGRAKVAADL
ncbi:MAG: hypothetical protein ACJA2W_003378 [Planctomycetota bacterium]|jgi:hypothetical protein